jgi:hypothetical protein
MRWYVTIDGKTETFYNKFQVQDRLGHLDWWAINKVEVISEAQPLAQWELDLLNGD